MRNDFKKLLVERGRHIGPYTIGSYRAVRDRRKVGEDDAGFTQAMRRPYGYGDKEVRDLLSPLFRFVRSRVGARWDDVYSEICAELRGRNAVQQHVIEHLLSAVETKIGIGKHGEWIGKNGCVFDAKRNGVPEFYVDPDSGILCASKWKARHASCAKPAGERKLADGRVLRKEAGIWYEITAREDEGDPPYYGVKRTEWKRQLSRKELRNLDLANDAADA